MATVVETIERDGVRVLVYDNGMERRADNGYFITPPKGTQITALNSTVLVRKRWENFRRKAAARIVGEAAAVDPTIRTAADAYALVASKQYVALMDYDKPRIDELEKLGNIMAGGPQWTQGQQDAPAAERAAELNAGAAVLMAQVWQDIKAHQATIPNQLHDTIDADVVE